MEKRCLQELLSLELEAPVDTWLVTSMCVVNLLEDARCLSDETLRTQATECIEHIAARLATHKDSSSNRDSLDRQLIDCMRLLLRFREPLSDRTAFEVIRSLCARIATPDKKAVANSSIRCLINIVFENGGTVDMLWRDCTLGADSLSATLGSPLASADSDADLHYNAAKLIFMTLAQK
jgi:hypothetical protein